MRLLCYRFSKQSAGSDQLTSFHIVTTQNTLATP